MPLLLAYAQAVACCALPLRFTCVWRAFYRLLTDQSPIYFPCSTRFEPKLVPLVPCPHPGISKSCRIRITNQGNCGQARRSPYNGPSFGPPALLTRSSNLSLSQHLGFCVIFTIPPSNPSPHVLLWSPDLASACALQSWSL